MSSAIATSFGALLIASRKSRTAWWSQLLTVLSPFVLITIVYLLIPNKSGLLYALTVSLGLQLLIQTRSPSVQHLGGRTELFSKLTALTSEQSAQSMQKIFIYWAPLSLLASLLHRVFPTQLSVYIPLLAFAVFAGSVQNPPMAEESR